MIFSSNLRFILILLVSLALSSFYFSTSLITRDDFYLNQIFAFIRDARIGVLPLYYPLVTLFKYDMNFILLGYVFLNLSVVSYIVYFIERVSIHNSILNLIAACIFLLLFYSFNNNLLFYKAAFITIGCSFIYTSISLKLLEKYFVLSTLFSALVFFSFQPFYLLTIFSVFVLKFSFSDREFSKQYFKFCFKYLIYSLLTIFIIYSITKSSFYLDYFGVNERALRHPFVFDNLSIEFYLKRLFFSIETVSSREIFSFLFLLIFSMSFFINGYKKTSIGLVLIIYFSLVLNPAIVMNTGFNTRAFQVLLFCAVYFSLVLILIQRVEFKLSNNILAIVVACIIFTIFGFNDQISGKGLLSIAMILLISCLVPALSYPKFPYKLGGGFIICLTALLMINMNYSVIKIEKFRVANKLDDKIFLDINYDILNMKKNKHDPIVVYIGKTRHSKYYSSINSYSVLDYFNAKNIWHRVKFRDAGGRCKGNQAPNLGDNELLYCF